MSMISLRRLRAGFLAAGLALIALCGAAQAQVTSLSMTSDSGDYIGQGQTYNYTPADGTFTAQGNGQGGVSIVFNAADGSHWWYLDFASATRGQLTTGSYLGAVRFPFNDGANGLSVSGDGRGCNTLTGSFDVRQITYGTDNSIAAFEASFEQHCEGMGPALRGVIRYNASATLYLSAPSSVKVQTGKTATFTVTGVDAQQRRVYLSSVSLPAGASFVDLGNSTGTFTWTPNATQAGSFVASFKGDNQQGNVATTSTQIKVVPPAPFNDDIASASPLNTVPASVSQVVTSATPASDDPYCFGNAQSVWYAFTAPATMRVEVNTFGSGYDTSIGVYTGKRGALSQVGCNGDSNNTLQSRVRFSATAGTTYYIMVSSQYFASSTANLVLNVLSAPPAFSFSPTVNQFGTVVPSTGAVTLSGTVQCTSPAFVSIYGSIRQGNTSPVTGYWNAWVPCDGVTRWTAPVTSTVVLFKGRSANLFSGGKATVGGTASAFDPETGEYRSVSFTQNVVLRGK
jgi:Bacterial pre-peptidase C-terminal domain